MLILLHPYFCVVFLDLLHLIRVIDQVTNWSSAHPSSPSGGIVTCPLRSLSCCSCCCCLRIFVWAPPRLVHWSCLLLLVIVSWTLSSCWGGSLYPPCSWGTGSPQSISCLTSHPLAPQNSHCFPPPIECMKSFAPLLLPSPPHAGTIAHSSSR